jgi:Polyketide cyclase / dehydrase and lipid transport
MTTASPVYTVRIERTRRLNAPVDRVAAVLEDTAQAPTWNPMLDTIAPASMQGQGLHSTLTWQAHVAGVPLSGTTETTVWHD